MLDMVIVLPSVLMLARWCWYLDVMMYWDTVPVPAGADSAVSRAACLALSLLTAAALGFRVCASGVGIVSQFGRMMRFSLKETFPLLTTKRVFWRGYA